MSFTRDTLRPSHRNALAEAAAWACPLFVGEFGYDPRGIRAEEYLSLQVDLLDEHGASSAYWLWKESSQDRWGVHDYDDATGAWIERPEVLRSLSRPRPLAIAGWPISYGYDANIRRFELLFEGNSEISAPSRIFVPEEALFSVSYEIRCDGELVAAERDPATGAVELSCGGAGEHTISLEAL